MKSDYKNQFPELPPLERAEILKANCDKIENITYNKEFDQEEIRAMQINLSEHSVEIANLEKELEKLTSPIKEKMKVLDKKVANIVSFLQDGYESITADTFKFVYHENDEVVYYDLEGHPVKVRSILPEERQRTIQSQSREFERPTRKIVNE